MKHKIKRIIPVILIAGLGACHSGGSTSSASGSVPVAGTIDFSSTKQYATPLLNQSLVTEQTASKAANASTACLAVTSSSFQSSGQYYGSGSFVITNGCGETKSLDGMQVTMEDSTSLDPSSFAYSTVSPWMEIKTSVVGITDDNGPTKLSITLETGGVLAPNASVKISYGYNSPFGNAPVNPVVSSDGEVTPVEPGNINLTINTSKLVTACQEPTICNIPVVLAGQGGQFESVIARITNSNVKSKIVQKLNGLKPSTYSLTVPANTLPPKIMFNAPNPILLAAGQTVYESASFSAAKVTTGVISYSINKPTGIDQNTLDVSVINAESQMVATMNTEFGKTVNVGNLTAGRYTLTSYGLADAIKGIFYNPLNKVAQVKANKTTELGAISLVAQPESNIVPAKLKITGLDAGDTATITFTDNYKGKQYKFNQLTASNGTSNLKLLKGDVVTLNVTSSAASKYEVVAPVTGTIKANTTLLVPFKHKSQPSGGNHIAVGYIDGTATGAFAAIPDAAFAKYDVLIVGFSACDADHVNCANNADDALVPIFQRVSKNAKSGTVMLLSLGGQNGSHSFSGGSNAAENMSTLAKSLDADIRYINSKITTPVKVTGVDLDIEANDSGNNITELAKALHQMGYLVSTAPQASTNGVGVTNPSNPTSVDSSKPSNFILTASGTTNNDYGAAIAAGYVDYINLQAYNSGPGVIKIPRENGGFSDETYTDFHQYIAKAMNQTVSNDCGTLDPVTKLYKNGNQVCIPSTTKILIGTVANKTAGGDATMWAYEEKTAAGNAKILAEYTSSVKVATQYQYYGGVMVWALGNDYYPSAWGGNTWDPAGAYTDNLVNLGF
ncbi:glycoside hydrolase family 18 protein [Aquella oligotrophica]|uniref:GH18 domain-containing protein n=1 Tax=Aquella oligotrophica TaxID=2067065 RepID=A0A2I7N8W0_9NEIS|nr:glycoside hydrolase family 18 protein [Aquella oligotrophica]AUR52879.1 hypothetical protein CUN60_11435 [Aquella oligotrophica]